jgi:hypothetical protein
MGIMGGKRMSEHSDGLLQFATDIQQKVLTLSEREGEEEFAENAFTELMLHDLGEAGEVEDAQLAPHQTGSGAQSLKINAWAVSGGESSDECLDLFVTLYTGENPPRTIPKDEMTPAFSKLKRFTAKAFQGYHYGLEESSRIFDACQRIDEIVERVTRIRFVLLTDGLVRADPPAAVDVDVELPSGRKISYRATNHVWDLERFYRLWSSGRDQEPIEVDFVEKTGAPIPCLAQPDASAEYAAYLAIIPGSVLAYLYGEYGSRLLERNVRSFLQARGKINAGIRKTIREEPDMFLAFNNGLAMTAASVDLVELPGGGIGLRCVRDLQVVNGGQTTASIFHALKKDKADLSHLFVQAKLTVIADQDRVDEIVPRISEYANSQNKVQTADFAANDIYHRELEKLSRTIWAPAKEGSQRQTHWYYERARGQYKDDIAREGTPGKQKEFQALNPVTQYFTKTDLAKYIQTWEQRPHIVSKGAQSCFDDFRARLKEEHLPAEGPVGEKYYQRLIAQAILFRSADKIIEGMMKRQGQSGYKANVVTYTLARISHDAKGRLDLYRIWREQALSPALITAIEEISQHVRHHITHPPGAGNVTQYCKQAVCWESFKEAEFPAPKALAADMKNTLAVSANVFVKDKRPESVRKAMAISSEEWFAVASWGDKTSILNGLQRTILCTIAADVGYGKEISSKQATAALALLADAQKLGYKG